MDEFLDLVGEYLVEQIQDEILKPRARFTKTGAPKTPPRYNFNATGALYESVSYQIVGGEIIILMNDYGVDYVFGGGSKPSTPPRSREAIESLRRWAEKKLRIPAAKSKGVAFAIGKNLNKVGYKGLPLLTKELQDDTFKYVDKLLEQPRFQDLILGDIFDRVNIFGTTQYNIAIS
jgi:hypothetical protein